jgi:tetratricopeptide (TPR) repeat protein
MTCCLVIAWFLLLPLLSGAQDACVAIAPHLAAAEKALTDGTPDTAEQILQPLRASSPDCLRIILLLGRTRATQGMPVLARNLLTEYTQRVPSDPAGQLALAQLLFEQGDYDGAGKALSLALQLRPGNLESLLLQARVFEAQHRDDDTQRVLLHACEIDPRNAEPPFRLGVLFDRQRRAAEAVKSFQKAVRIDPANASAWDYLALNLENTGEQRQAESAYVAGIKVNHTPRLDRFLDYNYGRFLMKRNRLQESEVWLNRAADLSPDTRAVFYERAKLYLLLSRYSEARADAERALEMPDPGQYLQSVQIYALLSSIYRHLGDTGQAQKFAMLARAATLKNGSGGRP